MNAPRPSAAYPKLVGLACLALAAMVSNSLSAAGDAYQGFALPAAGGFTVPPQELTFWAWYLTYGLCFVALFALGLERLGALPRLVQSLRRAARWRGWPVALPLAAGFTSVAVRLWVLEREVVTDDESTYVFIAQTLLEGRLVNPLPAQPEFFANQWVILNSQGWFGKYPIGHPLVLAAAIATRTLDVALPALGALTAWLTWKLGRALLGPRLALLALALVVLSPHYTWTHATLLSQPTSCFALIAASAAVARPGHAGWRRWAAGAALALGVLARPAPVLLFVPAILLHVLLQDRGRPLARRLAGQLPLALPVALAAAAIAAVNAAQAGSPLETGYHAVHGGLGFLGGSIPGQIGQSVFASVLRENFWLFGWPLSLLPVLFARPRRGRLLLWGPLLAQLAYRVAIPKTVVATTGPTYVMETVPVLAILAADGLARLRLLLGRWWGRRVAQERLVGAVLASFVAALALAAPVIAFSVHRGARARQVVHALVAATGAEKVVVFGRTLVESRSGLTWAYYPPNPHPGLGERVIFLRWPRQATREQVVAFWKAQFPDRAAFHFIPGSEPRLLPLESGEVPTAD